LLIQLANNAGPSAQAIHGIGGAPACLQRQSRAIAILLYANVQARARIAKGQADTRALASAISIYSAHMGTVAVALSNLTGSRDERSGPYSRSVHGH